MDWLIPFALAAQAMERTPLSYDVWTWLWVLGISAAGGIVSFHRKFLEGSARPFNIAELIGEMVTSAFAGAMTFLLCEYAGMSQLLSGALCGIVGHMGSRGIFLMEKILEDRAARSGGGQ